MRWPLRNQILVPFVLLLLGVICTVSALNAWLATQRTKNQIEEQLQGIAASPGSAMGAARVVYDVSGLTAVKDGEILITRQTGFGVGIILGVLFVAAGIGRLYMVRRRA